MSEASRAWNYEDVGRLLGPILATLLYVSPPPEGLDPLAWRTAAVAVWMAVWWATEAVPVAVTALIPIIVFPLLGVTSVKEAAAPYANPLIYLFMGGFMIAVAVERWELHRRVALIILSFAGGHPRRLIGGFMISAAAISMWITNTATTIMMLPIALSIVPLIAGTRDDQEEQRKTFGLALLLGVAYAASIGGMGTLVGTVPNALLAGFMQQTYGIEIGFAQWMLIGVPTVLVMVPTAWFLLVRVDFNIAEDTSEDAVRAIAEQRAHLGAMTTQEKRVGLIFLLTALLWVFRPFLTNTLGLTGLSDGGIALFGALLMFVVPADWGKREFLLNWEWASRIPFGALILFGGGLSLAHAINVTGLAVWLGEGLSVLGTAPAVILILGFVALIVFLTELTSNTATTAAFLPVVASVADQMGLAPISLTAPIAIAASCAFMLPVATPPNAIVFGSGYITVPQMARAGFLINLAGIAVVTLMGWLLLPLVFGP